MFPLFRRAVFFFTWHFVIKKKRKEKKRKGKEPMWLLPFVCYSVERINRQRETVAELWECLLRLSSLLFSLLYQNIITTKGRERERERVNQRTVCTRASPAAQEGPSSSSLFVSRGGRKRKTSKIWQKHAITFDTCSVMQVHALFLLLLLLPIHFHMMQRASERPEFNHRKVFFFLFFFFFVFSNFPF